jgi:hypothetical protein
MVEYIRGLPGVFGLVSPAAYRSQVNYDSKTEERPSQLVQSNHLVAGVTVTISEEALAMLHRLWAAWKSASSIPAKPPRSIHN